MTSKGRLVPTGDCFCGCGQEVEIGRWFVRGHDIAAAAALRALEGLSLPHRLVAAGYGPDRSVVAEAVERAGWVRCTGAGCAYAGTPDGLTAHHRTGNCAPTVDERQRPAAAPGPGPAVPEQTAGTGPADGPPRTEQNPNAGGTPVPARAGAGVAEGRMLRGADDPVWGTVPLHLRQLLRGPAYRLVAPVRGELQKNRSLTSAVRAAGRMRMTGEHWLLLMTAERTMFGGANSGRADAFWTALGQVLAQYPELTVDQKAEEPQEPAPAG